MSLRGWIRRQIDRYRAWCEVQVQRDLERLTRMATHPERVAQRRRENEREYGRLELDTDGFHLLKNGRTTLAVRWADVRTIRTYKRDLFAYDMVCLAFQVADDEWIEIWEDMVDFKIVEAAMRKRFPGIPENWFGDVMLPAFAPNDRILWDRATART